MGVTIIPLQQICSTVIQGLEEHTGLLVYEMDDSKDLSQTLCLGYRFSTNIVKGRGFPILIQEGDIQRQFDTIGMTLSIFSFAKNEMARLENSLKVREWFDFQGRLKLKEAVNVVVVDIGQNKDIENNLVSYETSAVRVDVVLRTVDITEHAVNTIEQANLKGAGHIGTT
ncbi:hypothetical protein J2Z69_003659 [Paenibacillus shirakamiensis]|uniref:Uncharacterized protein n=1 Tax=Paenibacillus shirakamiensis TaxID=1265935 RepID=A0ABS4JLJ4_9BACL|nr:hypothetical protein [Paenibacillus shirakamiensis]MBP2002573.1 hypothetical protein [Paenibacillus shirakamiensis]